MDTKDIKIGKKLKKARLSCGLTQEQVCQKIGCAPRYMRAVRNQSNKAEVFL